jgi:hypothetical protein
VADGRDARGPPYNGAVSAEIPAPLAPLPWEDRRRLGAFPAFVETVKLFFQNPAEAWLRAREKGDFGDPLLYAVGVTWAGIVLSSIYNLILPRPWRHFLPPELARRFPGLFATSVVATGCSIILAPIFIVIGLFIGAAILHVCLALVGALRQSPSGFEGTFRTAAYSSTANLAHVIPYVGWLIALVWAFYLNVKGIVRMHRTTPGRAVAAIVIPGIILIFVLGAVLVAVLVFLHRAGPRSYSL